MKLNKLVLVSIFLLAIFALSAVSASDDVSFDNLTGDEIEDPLCESQADYVLDENQEDILESSDNDLLSDKKDSGMEVTIVDEDKYPWDDTEFLTGRYDEYYFAVKFPNKVTGKLSLFIDDNLKAEKNITSKTHYLHLNTESYNLASGKHTAKMVYSGDGDYSQATWTGNFELVPYKIDCDNVIYETTEFLCVSIDDATGDVIATVEGKRYSAPLIRGIATISLPALGIGNHNVNIFYSGDKNHVSRSYDTTFIVFAAISGPAENYVFNEDADISLQLPSNAKGNLLVTLDGNEIGNVKLVNGFAKVSLPKFNVLNENHEVHAEYTGDDYNLWWGDYNLHSSYRSPSVKIESEMIVNHEYTLSFEVPSTYSGSLTVYVPGYDNPLKTSVVNGKASVKFIAKESGDVSWEWEDISGYSDYGSDWVIVGPDPNMAVSVDSKAGANPVIKVNVANDAGGAITVTINGKEYSSSYFTGKTSLTIPGLADGTYKAIVTYSGDYKYPAVTKVITFKKTSKISLTLKKVKVKKSAKKLVLQATLKINGKAVKGKVIKFKFNKKNYKAKTNKKGVAKVTIKKKILKKLKVGKKVKIQASYGKTVKKLTVKVKK